MRNRPAAQLRRHGVTVVGVLAVGTGVASLVLGYRGIAATVDLQFQVAFLVSGGLLGLAVTGIGCAFAIIQSNRRATLEVSRAHRALADEWRALSAVLGDRASTITDGAP